MWPLASRLAFKEQGQQDGAVPRVGGATVASLSSVYPSSVLYGRPQPSYNRPSLGARR